MSLHVRLAKLVPRQAKMLRCVRGLASKQVHERGVGAASRVSRWIEAQDRKQWWVNVGCASEGKLAGCQLVEQVDASKPFAIATRLGPLESAPIVWSSDDDAVPEVLADESLVEQASRLSFMLVGNAARLAERLDTLFPGAAVVCARLDAPVRGVAALGVEPEDAAAALSPLAPLGVTCNDRVSRAIFLPRSETRDTNNILRPGVPSFISDTLLRPGLPVFMLNDVVVLPWEEFTVNIFEPRYRRMIKHSIDNQSLFVIANPKSNIGTACRIERARIEPDGKSEVVAKGLVRVRIGDLESDRSEFGLMRLAACDGGVQDGYVACDDDFHARVDHIASLIDGISSPQDEVSPRETIAGVLAREGVFDNAEAASWALACRLASRFRWAPFELRTYWLEATDTRDRIASLHDILTVLMAKTST